MEVHSEVPNGPHAAAQARQLLDRFEGLSDSLLGDARLVLSEIVTNSYKHSEAPEGTPIQISISHSKTRIRIEVVDGSIFDPTPETSEELRSAKWGLRLVDEVSADWGRISEGGIWAELSLAESTD